MTGDVSPGARDDASVAIGAERRSTCRWCSAPITDPRATYCSTRCRQTVFRLRRRAALDDASSAPGGLRFAYADPPYPGLARKYYGREATFGGEVDHRALIASLEASGYAGWALSTSSRALRDVLPLCPPGARVCAWVKPIGVPSTTRGPHSAWEPVIVVRGRGRRHGVRDWLSAQPARGGGELMGRKPLAFCAWLFELLGMVPGDELVDVFPGTGIVGRAWAELSSGPRGDASPTQSANASLGAVGDGDRGAGVSSAPRGNASRELPATG